MPVKVKVFSLFDETSVAELVGPMDCLETETYADMRLRLQSVDVLDWPFQFWDNESECRIREKLEKLNSISGHVYVIKVVQVTPDRAKRTHFEAFGDTAEGVEFPDVDSVQDVEEIPHSEPLQPFESSRVSGDQSLASELDWKSVLLSKEVMEKYMQNQTKLKKELKDISMDDHLWTIKSSDQNGVGVVKLVCTECNKDFGGNSGDHSRGAINNMFSNFRNSHLISNTHVRSWCRRKGIPFSDHPQSVALKGKSVILTAADHKRLVHEGLEILQDVNDKICEDHGEDAAPFVVIGAPGAEEVRIFAVKIRCKICGDYFVLCPPKKNLAANLQSHLNSIKHTDLVEKAVSRGRLGGLSLSTGRRGRPPASSRSTVGNQRQLHSWFKVASESESNTVGREEFVEEASGNGDSILALLCWGRWSKIAQYANKLYKVDGLLQDPIAGSNWAPEPYTIASFEFGGKEVNIDGCFRHSQCKRFSTSGEPFSDYTCCECNRIPNENDFRCRVKREQLCIEKRGSRSTALGRRLGYLSIKELTNNSRVLRKKLKAEYIRYWSSKARVAQLKMTRPSLKDSSNECMQRNDLMKFCQNIVAAHRTHAFGGKPALWDFLKDVATNLNRKKEGHRFCQNSKSFAQAMKIYGGRRMCDVFALNYAGPSYTTIKRENQKGVQFVPGEHSLIFRSIAAIYKEAKAAHGIIGPVPVILAEDETKVKSRIVWEPQYDTLAGFCGSKENHCCISDYKPVVGRGEAGYNKIIDSFRGDKIGGFARVVVVNPLHEKLPRLVLSISCTCNCFDATWVRNQWNNIEKIWADECEGLVGPVIGHASDGDSRRRQLMLIDYTSKSGKRLEVGWAGWVLSAAISDSQHVHGLHDQDYIHNGKKLINPLDSPVRILQLGADVCCLEHIGLVYNKFTYDEHGLKLEDIQRTDRQNWASAQRLCQQKVRDCLRRMRVDTETHAERTLGTEMYLAICANYVDMFLSVKISLRDRVVLAAKVSFFFRLWKLWLKNGDHSVGGNTTNMTGAVNFVSKQCFLDVQMSCHFLVLLVIHFREKYPHLAVPLHLTGSDSCEIFFSKIGGMVGMERAYDFHELITCANTLNHLSALEYGDNGLKFGRVHNKMKNIWADLHPFGEGETTANLNDFAGLTSDDEVICALKDGFKEAQDLLRVLNMAPSRQAKNKRWYTEPWLEEAADLKHGFAYIPSNKPVAGEDGDGEVLRENTQATENLDDPEPVALHAEEEIFDDGLDDLRVLENEARDVISDMLNDHEMQITSTSSSSPNLGKVRHSPTVEFSGKSIYKSTLVSELNGNPFLSKDRLTRVRNSVYFNNADDYISAAGSESTCLLGLGSDCGVYFVQRNSTTLTSAVKNAKKRTRTNAAKTGVTNNVTTATDSGSWWLGRVQKMRKRAGSKWGISRQPIDLLNKPNSTAKKTTGPSVMVLLNWFSKTRGANKFKYDVTDTCWIDVDSIISTVTVSYATTTGLYTLNSNDAQSLDEFVQNKT